MKMIFTESELITLHELVNRKIDTECKTITENNIDNYVGLVALKAKLNALYKMSNPSVLTIKDNITIPNGGTVVPLPKIDGVSTDDVHTLMTDHSVVDMQRAYLRSIADEDNKKLDSAILGTNDGVLNHIVDQDESTTTHTDESKIKEVVRVRN